MLQLLVHLGWAKDACGYLASSLVLCTFSVTSMRVLRCIGITNNPTFIRSHDPHSAHRDPAQPPAADEYLPACRDRTARRWNLRGGVMIEQTYAERLRETIERKMKLRSVFTSRALIEDNEREIRKAQLALCEAVAGCARPAPKLRSLVAESIR
jgi:hypothetical protein